MARIDDLTERAFSAVNAIFAETSVSPEVTLDALLEVIDQAQVCVNAIKEDLRRVRVEEETMS